MEYVVCYNGVYKTVYGEDAMQILVSELMEQLNCDADEIMVFDVDSQL